MQGKQKRVMPLHWLVKLAAMTSYDIQASPLARPSLDSSLAPQAQHQPFLSSPTRRQTEAGPVVDRPTIPDVPCVVLRRVTLDGREALRLGCRCSAWRIRRSASVWTRGASRG